MAYIENYDPNIHDIYTYDGIPSLDLYNPPGPNALVNAIGYNPNLLILNPDGYPSSDPNYFFPTIDWSGLHVRQRGFMYNWQNVLSALQYFNNPESSYASTPPEQRIELLLYYYNQVPETLTESINNWNNGQPSGVLISPKHILVPLRFSFSLPQQQESRVFKFIGKNGQIYYKTGIKKIIFYSDSDSLITDNQGGVISAEYLRNNGFTVFGKYNNYCIFELDTSFTEEEQEQVKIYPLVKIATLAPNTKIFSQDSNGRLIITKVLGVFNSEFQTPVGSGVVLNTGLVYPAPLFILNEELYLPPGYPNLITYGGIGYYWGFHPGDEATFGLVNINGETCFLMEITNSFEINQQNRDLLKQYVYQNCGYEIREIDGGFRYPLTPIFNQIPPTNILNSKPYDSRFSTSTSSFNYNSIGYTEFGFVQAQELNELQEILYNQQSKTIEMIHNWFGNKLINEITFNGPTNISPYLQNIFGKDIFNKNLPTLTPLTLNQVYITQDEYIEVNPGWYFLKIEKYNRPDTMFVQNEQVYKSTFYRWIYNKNNYTISLRNNEFASLHTELFLIAKTREHLKDPSLTSAQMSTRIFLGADRFATDLLPYSYTNNIPSNGGITFDHPMIAYRINDKYYLPNGYKIN